MIPKIVILGRTGHGKTQLCKYLTQNVDNTQFIPFDGYYRRDQEAIFAPGYMSNKLFTVIDTPGFMGGPDIYNKGDQFYKNFPKIIKQADIFIILVRNDILPEEVVCKKFIKLFNFLKKRRKDIYLVINKYYEDGYDEHLKSVKHLVDDFPIKKICGINAVTGDGVAELMSSILTGLSQDNSEKHAFFKKHAFLIGDALTKGKNINFTFPMTASESVDSFDANPTLSQVSPLQFDSGNTLLHQACLAGDITNVEKHIAAGIPVNCRNHRGNTPLHILAQLCVDDTTLLIAKRLLASGADLNLVNCDMQSPLQLLTDSDKQADLIELFLLNRQPRSMKETQAHIAECTSGHMGDYEHREADAKRLDYYASQLTGVAVGPLMAKHKWTYLGHLKSLKGNYEEGNTGVKGNFELFTPALFLPLRCRILLELIVQLETGILSHRQMPSPYQTNLQKLYGELHALVEILRVYRDIFHIREKLYQEERFINAQGCYLTNRIYQLSPGESYSLYTGFRGTRFTAGHGIYANFTRSIDSSEEIIVRIDNLGPGVLQTRELPNLRGHLNEKIPFKTPWTGKEADNRLPYKAWPFAFRVPLSYFQIESGNAPEYVISLIFAKIKLQSQALSLIYDNAAVISESTLIDTPNLKQSYPCRRIQTANNCVAKNYNVGLQIRWQENDSEHTLYHWFREEEPKHVPLKSSLSTALLVQSKPQKGNKHTDGQAVIKDARLHGYTDLHLAVVVGDSAYVKRALLANPELLTKTTHNGYTALHLAALYGRDEITQIFLTHAKQQNRENQLLNAKTTQGDTALHLAAKQNYASAMRCVTFLTEQGAQRTLKNSKGLTALNIAANEDTIVLLQMSEPSSGPETISTKKHAQRIKAQLWSQLSSQGVALSEHEKRKQKHTIKDINVLSPLLQAHKKRLEETQQKLQENERELQKRKQELQQKEQELQEKEKLLQHYRQHPNFFEEQKKKYSPTSISTTQNTPLRKPSIPSSHSTQMMQAGVRTGTYTAIRLRQQPQPSDTSGSPLVKPTPNLYSK